MNRPWSDPGPPDPGPPAGIGFGHCSESCGKALSEDFFDMACPDAADVERRGLVFGLADGMSGGAGRRAAEICVRTVLSDFYDAPPSWDAARSLDRSVAAVNGWLLAHNLRATEAQCMLTTLSVLVLHERAFHIAHVGDSRIYRLREGVLERMTTDHVWPRRDMRHVLRRAVGLDHHLVVDCFSGDLRVGDRFVMLTDGVWEVLGEPALQRALRARAAAQPLANALVTDSIERQRAYLGRNDATAAVIDVQALAPGRIASVRRELGS
ncbi:MAG: serine/threonine-protein phosphatase [Burkholderiales bacterium]|nr:serine/threonine-protein phosphatase [Burkholderiales bacterium]